MLSSSSTSRMRAGIGSGGQGVSPGVVVTWTGQLDGERRARAELAGHADLAAVALQDGVHHGEPEAGALARGLGGVEWVEDVTQVRGGDPDPVVAHLEPHAVAVQARRAQEQVAAL